MRQQVIGVGPNQVMFQSQQPGPGGPHPLHSNMRPHVHPHMIAPPMHQSHPASGFSYGTTVFRVNFWVKMTTALGVTQITIGICCVAFYLLAYLTDHRAGHLVRYVGVGLATGTVIFSAGTVALLVVRKKTKFMISSFMLLSTLAAMFALFPLVLGIVGASSTKLADEEGLLMPICQLVFATVEMMVAAWSIGVCCQALCCPNTSIGQLTTRLPPGMGVTQFLATTDGHHVVLFTSAVTQTGMMYNTPHQHAPVILQNGISTMQIGPQPGGVPPYHQGVPHPMGVFCPGGTAVGQPQVEASEEEKCTLLDNDQDNLQPALDTTESQERGYDIEDENVRLLC